MLRCLLGVCRRRLLAPVAQSPCQYALDILPQTLEARHTQLGQVLPSRLFDLDVGAADRGHAGYVLTQHQKPLRLSCLGDRRA